jgi:crotonobetainyl-CoA:carnitine CoA-transferase CaiB-like acyl-CoA transferase
LLSILESILQGVRVLELSHGENTIASRVAAMILKHFGATVIKTSIENDSGFVEVTDWQKDSVVIDSHVDTSIIRDLLDRADVVIYQELPETMLSLIDKHHIENNSFIRCAIPLTDTKEHIVNEDAISALCGLFETPTGIGKPHPFNFPVASTYAAFHAVNAIAAGLVANLRHSQMTSISIPLTSVGTSLQCLIAMMRSEVPLSWTPIQWLSSPFMAIWKSADSKYFYLHAAIPKHLRTLLSTLKNAGFPDQVNKIKTFLDFPTKLDPSKITTVGNALQIERILDSVFRCKEASFWEDMLCNAGLCCSVINSFSDWIHHDQVTSSGELHSVLSSDGQTMLSAGTILSDFSGIRRTYTKGNSITVTDILNTWPSRNTVKAYHPGRKLPLDGTRVLDMSNIIAGPYAGRICAEYGADVLHITTRKGHLSWEEPFHVAFGSGKTSISIDCTKVGGKELLLKTILEFKPDIFIHNFPDESIEKLGLSHSQIKQHFVNIVYINIRAFNADGIWKNKRGLEQNIQACSGIIKEYGSENSPTFMAIPFNDLCAGTIGAIGAMLGYYNLLKGNGGSCFSTSLTIPALYLRLDNINKKNGNCENVLSNFYRTSDKQVYVSINAIKHKEIFSSISEFQCVLNSNCKEKDLSRIFKSKSAEYWQRTFSNSSVSEYIHIVKRQPIKSILHNELTKNDGLFFFGNHRVFGNLLMNRTPVHLSPLPLKKLRPASPIGNDTVSFFEHGLDTLQTEQQTYRSQV